MGTDELNRIFYFNITFACNNKCEKCISYSTTTHVSSILRVTDFEQIDQLYRIKKSDIININGGEPTLSPYFDEIIDWCYNKTPHIIVYSNGRRLTKLTSDTIQKIERFIIPLYGNEEFHNKYTGIGQSFLETIESINRIIDIDSDKCEIKILFDESKNAEALIQSNSWEGILKNHRFSVSRILKNYDDTTPCSMSLSRRAEQLIQYFINKNKIVKFYDLPICQFSYSFQEFLMNTYVNKNVHISKNAIYCGNNGQNQEINYNHSAIYWDKCIKCNSSIFCTQIMHNYFCPTIMNGKCIIQTE